MNDSSKWDLLSSNESGSEVCWPESEFEDSASLAESLSLIDGDFGDEPGDLAELSESEHNNEHQLMRDEIIPVDKHLSEIDALPLTQNAADGTAQLISSFSFNHDPTSMSSPISGSAIMDRMVSLLETAVYTIIDLLNSPKKLSESEFVKSLLDDMEWDCEKLKENVDACPPLVKRLNALISRIADCIANITYTVPDFSTPTTYRGLPSPRSDSDEIPILENAPRVYSEENDKRSQPALPEWRQHSEPSAPTSSLSSPRSTEALHLLRQDYHRFSCQCPSACPSHPSVFTDMVSPFSTRCAADCRCAPRREERSGNGTIKLEDWVSEYGKDTKAKQARVDSWRLVQAHLDQPANKTGGSVCWTNV